MPKQNTSRSQNSKRGGKTTGPRSESSRPSGSRREEDDERPQRTVPLEGRNLEGREDEDEMGEYSISRARSCAREHDSSQGRYRSSRNGHLSRRQPI